MAPAEHLAWLVEDVEHLGRIPVGRLGVEVPRCPGWDVEHVLVHLAFGLGIAYPHALDQPPHATEAEALASVPWPTEVPTGAATIDAFRHHLGACVERFDRVDPSQPCWTYAGPGTAAFWIRRAAIEVALHRMDVDEALDATVLRLTDVRADEIVDEAIEFALPFAATIGGRPAGRLVVETPTARRVIGTGSVAASVSGDPHSVACALWGRDRDRVSVSGEREVAEGWLGLIETAFAGR